MRGVLIVLCVFSVLILLTWDVATAAICSGGKCFMRPAACAAIPLAKAAPKVCAPANDATVRERPVLQTAGRALSAAKSFGRAAIRAPLILTGRVAARMREAVGKIFHPRRCR